jgi:uncharacterized protein (DUF2252 family)
VDHRLARLLDTPFLARVVPHLTPEVPLRYGRMLQSPFTFYRGRPVSWRLISPRTPVSGIHVQVCGDCHLMNFGGLPHRSAG